MSRHVSLCINNEYCEINKFKNDIIVKNFILSKYVKGNDKLDLYNKCVLLNVDVSKVIVYSELKLTLVKLMNEKVNKKTILNILCSKIRNNLGCDYQVYFDLLNIIGNIQNLEGLKVKNVFKCDNSCLDYYIEDENYYVVNF